MEQEISFSGETSGGSHENRPFEIFTLVLRDGGGDNSRVSTQII